MVFCNSKKRIMSDSRDFAFWCKGIFTNLPQPYQTSKMIEMIISSTVRTGGASVSCYWGDMTGEAGWAVSLFIERSRKCSFRLGAAEGQKKFEGFCKRFLDDNLDLLEFPNVAIGVWTDDLNYYFDVSVIVFSEEEALSLGTHYNQIAVANLACVANPEIEDKQKFRNTNGDGRSRKRYWLPEKSRPPFPKV
jgi:hypothetical protein